MGGTIKKILLPLALLLLWAGVIYAWTDGLKAFTFYSLTLLKAGPLPRPFPNFPIKTSKGKIFYTKDFKGNYLLVSFFYTECRTSVCHLLTSDMEQIYEKLKPLHQKKLILLNLSFNVKQDTPELLSAYQEEMGIVNHKRLILGVLDLSNFKEVHELLKKIGIWVYRLPDGSYNHSAILIFVNPEGRVIAIFNPGLQSIDSIVQTLKTDLVS
ncbi:MAG: SCO family protein [Firmicutes bacterium]|jgi:protein SCO1/2|nr:SCO family protein [Bacillota bacterium]